MARSRTMLVRLFLWTACCIAAVTPSAGAEDATECALIGVRIRNQTCRALEHGKLYAARKGKDVIQDWCVGTVQGGSSVTSAAPRAVGVDEVYVDFCVAPGLVVQGSITPQGPEAAPRLIRSVFIQTSCCPAENYLLAYFHDGGPTVRARLTTTSGRCSGARECSEAAQGSRLAGSSVKVTAAAAEREDVIPRPFQIFRVKNEHPQRRIVRARARPYLAAVAKPTVVHLQVGPGADLSDGLNATNNPEGADKVFVSVCLDDDQPVRAWEAARGGKLIFSIEVTLDAAGTLVLAGETYGGQTVNFTPIDPPPAEDACPRLESFRVINQHPNMAVVKAEASPAAGGYSPPAGLIVEDVAATNGDKTTTATTQDEGQSVTVRLCLAAGTPSIAREIHTNNPSDRIKTITATVSRDGNGQPVLELAVTLLDLSDDGVNAQSTQGAQTAGPVCPLP
jgi:hypothetical protein